MTERNSVSTVTLGLASLVSALPDPAVVLGEDDLVIAANQAAKRIFGDSQESFRDCLPAGLGDGAHTMSLPRSDGITFDAEVNVAPLDSSARRLIVIHDVTEARQAASQLADAERSGRLGTWGWHIPTGTVTCSPQALKLTGQDAADVPDYAGWMNEHTHPDDRDRVRRVVADAVATGGEYEYEQRILTRGGEIRHVHVRGQMTLDEEGQPLQGVGVIQDITDRVQQRAELERVAAQREAVLNSAAEGICGLDAEGRVTFANPAAASLLGATTESLASEALPDRLVHEDPAILRAAIADGEPIESADAALRRDGGLELPIDYQCAPLLQDGEPVGAVFTFADASERKRYEEQLRFLAEHDALTGLMNRRGFEEEVAAQTLYAKSYGGSFAVLVLDLDQFKDVNDTGGHGPGDELLRSIARLLRSELDDGAALARLGGDEFAVLLATAGSEIAMRTAERLRDAVAGHVMFIGGRRLNVTVSIGVAIADGLGLEAAGPLSDADVAMYQAKENGRNTVSIYRREHGGRERMQHRLTWSAQIRETLDAGRMQLYAQPIASLVDEAQAPRFEVLVRMPDPEGGVVLPGVFLPVAERHGLVTKIDRWVIAEAIRLAARERALGRETILEINLSGRSMGDPTLPGHVADLLSHADVAPGQLVFEVTETAAIDSLHEAKELASALIDLGCAFAIDDFGAGFGSFTYLKHLPSQYVKIDGEFVRRLPSSPTDQLVVRAIVELAHGMRKKVIAEFVEDERTMALLREFYVDFAQGYHIGYPAPSSDLLGVSADEGSGRPAPSAPQPLL